MSDPEIYLDCADLARILRLSPRTVQANASRRPDLLPPRAPNVTRLLWLPSAVAAWQRPSGAGKGGRPRNRV